MKTQGHKIKNRAQGRPEQLNTKQLPKIDLALRRENRALKTENLLALLRREAPKFFERAGVIDQSGLGSVHGQTAVRSHDGFGQLA